jgi:hypothetical protein
VSGFSVDNAHHETVRTQRMAIRDLVARLDEHGSWVLKEPRLCLLLPIFQSALINPLAVIALRHPVESARSLRRRNGFPMQAGLALWEAYTVSLLRTALAMDHVFVSFDELIGTPHEALGKLAGELQSRGVTGLDVDAAAASIQSALRRERFDWDADRALLTSAQAALWKRLSGSRMFRSPPKLSDAAVTVLREFEADETARTQDRAAVKALSSQVAGLKASQADGKAAEQRHLAKLQDSERKIDEQASELDRLTRAIAEREAALDSLRSELQTARLASAAQDCRLAELEAALSDARATGADAQELLASLAAALDDLQRRHAERGRLLTQATRQLRVDQERQRALDNAALRAELNAVASDPVA